MDLKFSIAFAILLLTFDNISCNVARIDPLVDTNVGLIKGLRATDGEYSMFLGIPYARVDETNPFGASIPITNFDNVFEAYHESTACPHVNNTDGDGRIVGELDCLHLNVYVPNTANSQNRVPVMVWIHGGAFHRGTASRIEFGPKYLVKQNVILVTLNYRLGPYGFMCLDTPDVPGNQGMKDQLTALRWIRSNIQAFGGDVNKITLFGESAGAISVDLHLLSEHRNLFNSVILQSGTSLGSTVLEEPDKLAPIKLSEALGLVTDSTDEALIFLKDVNPTLVIAATTVTGIQFKPCVEQSFNGVEPFILGNWINSPMPKVRNLPVLIGFTSKERVNYYADKDHEFYTNLNIIHERLAQTFNFDEEELIEMENYIHHFYLGDNKYSDEYKNEIGEFDSDYTYIHPIHRSIKKYLASSARNVFLFMFSYKGERNYQQNKLNDSFDGTVHADELGYIFDRINMSEEPSGADQLIIDRVTTMWANFAKYSDPTPMTTELLPVKWSPVSTNQWNYLNIDSELTLGTRPYHSRMAFWDLFYKLNEKKQKGYVDA